MAGEVRIWVTLTAVILAGCAIFIPDYNAKKHKWKPEEPQIIVQIFPNGNWWNVCVNDQDDEGRWFRLVTVRVMFIEMEPKEITLDLNDGYYTNTGVPPNPLLFQFPGGVGVHTVKITTPDGFRAVRHIAIYQCDKKKVPRIIEE